MELDRHFSRPVTIGIAECTPDWSGTMEHTMGEIRDQRRAVALVATIILTAGMFAGFSFGTTARDGERNPAPLLLQSVHLQRAPADEDCTRAELARQAGTPAPRAAAHPPVRVRA